MVPNIGTETRKPALPSCLYSAFVLSMEALTEGGRPAIFAVVKDVMEAILDVLWEYRPTKLALSIGSLLLGDVRSHWGLRRFLYNSALFEPKSRVYGDNGGTELGISHVLALWIFPHLLTQSSQQFVGPDTFAGARIAILL